MTYQQPDMYSRTADWLVDTAKRKPEALLLMAAGCVLMMRSGRRRAGSVAARTEANQGQRQQNPMAGRSPSSGLEDDVGRAAETAAGNVRGVAEKLSGAARAYASNVADHATDYAEAARQTVSAYADDARRTATHYAEGARRNISQTSERLMNQAETTYQSASEAIREQPALVAAFGLAAGVAVAALFPTTGVERRTLGATSDALVDAAAETGKKLAAAASKTGERLKETVAEHGLNSEGLKDMVRDVAGTFTSAAAEKTDQDRSVSSLETQSSGNPGRSAVMPGAQTSDAAKGTGTAEWSSSNVASRS